MGLLPVPCVEYEVIAVAYNAALGGCPQRFVDGMDTRVVVLWDGHSFDKAAIGT